MQDSKFVTVVLNGEHLTIEWECSGGAWLHTPTGVQVALASEGEGEYERVSLWTGRSAENRQEIQIYRDGTVIW